MKGLLLQLSEMDSDAASALRIIDFFDTLVTRDASPRAFVRASAGLANCVVGWRLTDGRVLRSGPAAGTPADEDDPSWLSDQAPVEGGGAVWLERPGGPGAHDALFLERMALAARALPQSVDASDNRPTTSALVEVVLSDRTEADERLEALKRLGLHPLQPLVVLAVSDSRSNRLRATVAAAALSATVHPGPTPMALFEDVAAVLLQVDGAQGEPGVLRARLSARLREESPVGMTRVGIGRPLSPAAAPTSWGSARIALRFARLPRATMDSTDPKPVALADHDALGPSRLLAHVSAERIRDDPDVARLIEHGRTPAGAQDIKVLAAFCERGSLRKAADALHFHHSTVAAHLARIEKVTDWDFRDPYARFAAELALLARDISDA